MSRCNTVVRVDCRRIKILRHSAGSSYVRQEVFYQDTDPSVSYPAINFKEGVFPAYPDVPVMLVNVP